MAGAPSSISMRHALSMERSKATSRSSRWTFASSSASDVASGCDVRGKRGVIHVDPDSRDHRAAFELGENSRAFLRRSIITSLGQRRSAASPVTSAIASLRGEAQRQHRQRAGAPDPTGSRRTIDTYNPGFALRNARNVRAARFPPTCPSAPTTVPCAHPSRASCAARIIVDGAVANHRCAGRAARRARVRDQRAWIPQLISTAAAEWVIAPEEMKSGPASA